MPHTRRAPSEINVLNIYQLQKKKSGAVSSETKLGSFSSRKKFVINYLNLTNNSRTKAIRNQERFHGFPKARLERTCSVTRASWRTDKIALKLKR